MRRLALPLALSFVGSMAHAECWLFVGKGIDGIATDYGHPADRLCVPDVASNESSKIVAKLYFQGETIANLILVKPKESRHWYISEERTTYGSYQIVGDKVLFDFPLTPQGPFRLTYEGQTYEFPAMLEK